MFAFRKVHLVLSGRIRLGVVQKIGLIAVNKLFPDTITSTFNLQNTTNNIQLYPNPAKEEVTIIINHADYISQQTTISVYDVMGNVVLRKEQSKTSNLKLQTSNLCKGIYLVEVKSNNSIYRSKLIKE